MLDIKRYPTSFVIPTIPWLGRIGVVEADYNQGQFHCPEHPLIPSETSATRLRLDGPGRLVVSQTDWLVLGGRAGVSQTGWFWEISSQST